MHGHVFRPLGLDNAVLGVAGIQLDLQIHRCKIVTSLDVQIYN